jgi:fibronectin type 3 domain-containing protein
VKAYTGKGIKPVVTVKDGKKTLEKGTHYKVLYKNNVKCGTATVKITGIEKNGYKGSKTISFKIRPAKVKLTAKSAAYNKVKLSWKKVEGAVGYKIYRSSDNKNFKMIGLVKSGSKTYYYSTKLKTGKTYYYKVCAYAKVKSGEKTYVYNGEKSSTVKAKPALAKGKIVSAKNVKAKSAKITWNKVTGADGYVIYKSSTNKSGSFKVLKTIKSGKTVTYTNTNMKKGETYYYKVKAYRVVDGKRVYGVASPSKSVKITK